jgi:predicted secreted hydrolase
LVNPLRRRWLHALAAIGAASPVAATPGAAPDDILPADDDRISASRSLRFPRDHGAHLGAAIEWWYATGWIAPKAGELLGWQVTFFRRRTGLAETVPGRFAARQLLLAQVAVSDLAARKHRHSQRVARWAGDLHSRDAHAGLRDAEIRIGTWLIERSVSEGGKSWRAQIRADEIGLQLDLRLNSTQPLLLQGQDGYSRKGPLPDQASHYYSAPQLEVVGPIQLDGRSRNGRGQGWLDHEWSDHLLPEGAVGWDWLGINLSDGSALTVFRLRRSDGSALWAGGSHRAAGATTRVFEAAEVTLKPGKSWTSAATGAVYPVEWTVQTPVGTFGLRALLAEQELAGQIGAVYWEGLSELLDGAGHRIGLGYLEMTGYAGRLVI